MRTFTFESFSTSAGNITKRNEDLHVCTPRHFAMIDGATPRTKNGRRFLPNFTDGSDAVWLVQQAADYIRAKPWHGDDLRDYVRQMGHDLKAIFEKSAHAYDDVEKPEVPCAAFTIAGLSADGRTIQIAGLADIETYVEMKNGEIVYLKQDPLIVAAESDYIVTLKSYMAAHNCDLATAMAHSMEKLRAISMGSNHPNSFGVLNVWDAPPNECFAYYETFVADDVRRIIMHTDGIDARYNVFTPQDLVAAAGAKYFDDIITRTRDVERDDPAGDIYARSKTHDDATIASAAVTPSP